MNLMQIYILRICFINLTLYVNFVESDNAFLQLFVVVEMLVQNFVHIVFILLFESFLFSDFLDCFALFMSQTFILEFHVLGNEVQIFVFLLKMFHFIIHFGALLI